MSWWRARLKTFIAGAALAGVGYWRLAHGVDVVRHYTGQPMFSYGLIAAGVLLILFAALPERLINRLVEVRRGSRKLGARS